MIEITKRLEIDAGHRLLRHESKCAHVHGHRYAFEITVTTSKLDPVGRVVDFSVIKENVGGWLEEHLDHAMIVQEGDPLISWLRDHDQRHHVVAFSPTAENLAKYVARQAQDILPDMLRVVEVVCYETPTSRARWVSPDRYQ